ncbi:MAG: TIGR01777 family oxidoreductase [Pirellula sp.]
MPIFERSSRIPFDRQWLYDYHAAPGAIHRLIPPWERVEILQRGDSLSVGTEVVLAHSLFGLRIRWRARHTKLDEPCGFQDVQIEGPFEKWIHDHQFVCDGENASRLIDRVEYETRFGAVGRLAVPWIESKLSSMFAYRHQTTIADLLLKQYIEQKIGARRLRIAVTGSSGMIGRRLVDLIAVLGHTPIRIVRRSSIGRAEDYPINVASVIWDAQTGFENTELMDGLDAVIHLSGQGIASSRWTPAYKESIYRSRVDATQKLVEDFANLPTPPRALVCASGVGIYGEQGDKRLDEAAAYGSDFLATLASAWEAAAMEFRKTGGRVAMGRLGMVLHPRFGALGKLIPPFRWGVGGKFGPGTQYWSWIHVDDATAAFLAISVMEDWEGAFNLVAPESLTNKEFSRILGHSLNRPHWMGIPSSILRGLLGEMADVMLLSSVRAECSRLQQLGFPFRSRDLDSCLRHLLGIGSRAANQ